MMNLDQDQTNADVWDEVVAELKAVNDAVDAGVPLEKLCTVRNAALDIQVHRYTPDDLKRVRLRLNASQALLARFLGVSANAIRSWEQGVRPVPKIACRYLDDVLAYPEIWTKRLSSPAAKGPNEESGA
jgi:DNA-binding transcriptional regulator YiaG